MMRQLSIPPTSLAYIWKNILLIILVPLDMIKLRNTIKTILPSKRYYCRNDTTVEMILPSKRYYHQNDTTVETIPPLTLSNRQSRLNVRAGGAQSNCWSITQEGGQTRNTRGTTAELWWSRRDVAVRVVFYNNLKSSEGSESGGQDSGQTGIITENSRESW
jgi:hypothetical protein